MSTCEFKDFSIHVKQNKYILFRSVLSRGLPVGEIRQKNEQVDNKRSLSASYIVSHCHVFFDRRRSEMEIVLWTLSSEKILTKLLSCLL